MKSSTLAKPSAMRTKTDCRQLDFATFSNIIGGQPTSTKSLRCGINPATNEALIPSPVSTPEDVENAITWARSAFKTWKRTPAEYRKQQLRAFSAEFLRYKSEFGQLLTTEQGKPVCRADSSIFKIFFKGHSNDDTDLFRRAGSRFWSPLASWNVRTWSSSRSGGRQCRKTYQNSICAARSSGCHCSLELYVGWGMVEFERTGCLTLSSSYHASMRKARSSSDDGKHYHYQAVPFHSVLRYKNCGTGAKVFSPRCYSSPEWWWQPRSLVNVTPRHRQG